MDKEKQLTSRKQRKEKNDSSKKQTKFLVLILILIFVLFSLFGCTKVLGVDQWKDFDPEKIINVKQTSLLYDDKNNLITGIYGEQNRIKVSIDQIPKHVRNAFIAVEDVRFYEHKGIDIRRIAGAIIEDIKAGGFKQGASTISQQLIKLSHLTRQKTISRKLQEAYLAYQLEKKYSKDEILEMYLNFIYFGSGAYGIETASKTYFGKSVSDLTNAEAALLAGIPKSPTKYSPYNNVDESIKRRNLILDLMDKYEFISPEEANKAKAEKVVLSENERGKYPYGYYVDEVIKEAAEKLKVQEEELYTGGYKIYTSLDPGLQNYCQTLYENNSLFPQSKDKEQVESALTILDPSTAEIKTLVGGREYKARRGLNRATQMIRQPGSAIKPILVYGPAINNFGYTPVSFVLDAPVNYKGYSPSNAGGKFSGWVTLRQAVAKSINIPAVKIFNEIGVESGKSYAKKVGISFAPEDRNLGLALGGFHTGVSPLALSSAYIPFANNGKYATPTTIRYIESPTGEKIFENKPDWKQVLSPENAFIMTNVLQSVITSGTGTRLSSLSIPLAGKTGTVELPDEGSLKGLKGNKDAWMTVYNPEYLVTVWMGYDKTDRNHYLASKATGGTYPADIIKEIYKFIYKNKKAPDFKKPPGVIEASIDSRALFEKHEALLANALTPDQYIMKEYFTQSTLPTKETDYWVIPQPPDDLTVESSSEHLPLISFTPKNNFAIYRLYKQKEMNPPILVGEYSDKSLKRIQIKDNLVLPGDQYEYFVVPIHPELIIDNKPLEGPSSERILYTVSLPLNPIPEVKPEGEVNPEVDQQTNAENNDDFTDPEKPVE